MASVISSISSPAAASVSGGLWRFTMATALLVGVTASMACDDEVVQVPGSLTGQACAEDTRLPLPSVLVEARDVDGVKGGQALTNAEGGFRINALTPGPYTVVALVDDVEVLVTLPNTTIEVFSGEVANIEDVRCAEPPDPPSTGTIDGQICNRHTGELVSEATIAVIGPDAEPIVSAQSDSLGNFVLEEVPEGRQIVSVRAPQYSRSFPVDVEVEKTITLDLAEGGCEIPLTSGGAIVGSLCDPAGGQGARLSGARACARKDGAAASSDVCDLSDTNGEFYIGALAPGSYTVTVQLLSAGINETFFGVVVEAGAEAVVVGPDACADRTPVGRVEGQICDLATIGGRFVGDVLLKQGGVERYRTTSDPTGRFRFEVVATGTYDLQLGDPAVRTISPITVNPFQTAFIEESSCPEPADICEPFTHEPEVASDGRIIFVVDRSGSMQFDVFGSAGTSKMDALRNGISSVTGGLAGTVSYGLFVYPNPADDSPDTANCGAGVQRVAAGSGANAITTSLNAVGPSGGTPTAKTMRAVLPILQGLTADERPLAVVLATDGAPNCDQAVGPNPDPNLDGDDNPITVPCTCTSALQNQTDASCAIFNCLDQDATVDAIADIAALGVQTHVVGIPDQDNALQGIFNQSLNAMAVAGGAPLPGTIRFHSATNTNLLQASLEAVTRRILACAVTTPFDLTTATSVEVRLGNAPIPQDPSQRNGWDRVGDSSIRLFGDACDRATESALNVVVERCARP